MTSRIFQPKDVLLFSSPPQNCGANAAAFSIFSIPTPSARVMAKIALFFWPSITGQGATLLAPPSNPVDPFQSGAFTQFLLNLYTGEQTETGWLIPTVDLVGTVQGLAGQAIPVNSSTAAGLGGGGYSLDVQGGQDAVGGLVLFPGTAGYAAANRTGINLSLRVRYEVVGSEMCQDEWEFLKSKMQITAPPTVKYT